MVFSGDFITVINTVLCLIILILAFCNYSRKADRVSILIGIAFGLFGLSHIATLMGLRAAMENFLIIVRILAYLIVILALVKSGQK